MKKTIFLAAVAAIIAITSCQKEAPVQNQSDDPVFTAEIATSKTTIDAATGKVAWEATDTITITDNAATSAKYAVSDIDAEGKATFVKTSEETNTLGDGPYTATYGIAPELEQIYSETAPALPMTAESETRSLMFTVTSGLLELSLTAGEKITGIEVTGIPTGKSETTYTLTCPEVNIASGAKFFIALPAGSYTSFLIKGQNGAQCKKSGSGVAIQANHITPVSFSKALHFAVQLWEGGPYWATTNIGAEKPEDCGQYFAWGYAEGCVRNSANDGWVLASDGATAKTFNIIDFPPRETAAYQDAATANWGADWSLPTDAQFKTLINKDESNKCTVTFVTTGTKGIKITGKGDYAQNSIFFPAAGLGCDIALNDAGVIGYYWSSVQDTFMGEYAYILTFYPGYEVSKVEVLFKCYGQPVRPIRSSL